MTRRTPLVIVSFLAAALVAGAVLAAPGVRVTEVGDAARLTVRGKLVASFRVPNKGLSAPERAARAAERLRQLLADGLKPEDISVRSRGEAWGVYANGGLLMIATPEEAELRQEDAETTARRWAANLKSALDGASSSEEAPAKVAKAAAAAPKKGKARGRRTAHHEPTLELDSTNETVPVGEKRLVHIKGTATGAISLKVDGDETVTARLVKGGIELRGVAPGKVTVHVLREGLDASVVAWCKKKAGSLGETPVAEVTGMLTPAFLVRKAAVAHALEGVRREDGARAELAGPVTGVKALARGTSTVVEFPVLISGEGYLPVRTSARVRIKNRALQPQDPKVLLYSNEPESVKELGSLYYGLVDNTAPVRLFYHHQSKMPQPFTFQVHLVNPSDNPAEVQVIQGDAGPTLDTVEVGHRAGDRYWAAAQSDIGYVVQIPPRSSRLVYATSVPNLGTVSGIYTLRVLNGDPVVAYIAAEDRVKQPEVSAKTIAAAKEEVDVYPAPRVEKRFEYVIGERWAFIPLGKDPLIASNNPQRKLFGNYGVTYDLTIDVKNPTDETRKVRAVMSSEAGLACGMFRVDGKLMNSPQLAPGGEFELWSGKLDAGATRTLRIETVPLGGSAYPVSIVVKAQ